MTWQKLQQPRIEHVGRPIGAVAACTGTPVDVEAAHIIVSFRRRRTHQSRSAGAYLHMRTAGRTPAWTWTPAGSQIDRLSHGLTWTCIDRSVDVDGGGTYATVLLRSVRLHFQLAGGAPAVR